MSFEIVERNRKDVSTTCFCPILCGFRRRLCDLLKKVPLKRKQKNKLMTKYKSVFFWLLNRITRFENMEHQNGFAQMKSKMLMRIHMKIGVKGKYEPLFRPIQQLIPKSEFFWKVFYISKPAYYWTIQL